MRPARRSLLSLLPRYLAGPALGGLLLLSQPALGQARAPALAPAEIQPPGQAQAPAPALAPAEIRARGQAQAPAPFDGIAAVVNGEVISIGEVRRTALLAREDKLGVGALCEGRTMLAVELARGEAPAGLAQGAVEGELTRGELERARECLIDTRLVFREVRRFPRLAATDEQLDAMMATLAEQFESSAAFAAEMQRLSMTRPEIRSDLRRQLLVADYVDGRFRATVDISDEQARAAWEQEFVPDMEAEGVAIPSFESVADNYLIPILQQREVNRRVQSWILDLRERATIRRMYP